ncbi:hypothetical protein ACH5RR_036447 [Cinchona calisaya]|uniref:Uncharacterized protein n=1 Tax=Cinchona calisaya TaxID=153742 RepID=A0ABD2Y4G9_9GENT
MAKKQSGTHISNGSVCTSKPALFRWYSSFKGHHEHLMTKKPHGFAYALPILDLAASENLQSSFKQETAKMDLQIISKEEIKPASPTPHHLRTLRFSLLDQISPDCYTSLLFFFSSNCQKTMLNINDVISDRRRRLKQSLFKILVPFYPLAGKIIKDGFHIECNDDGVYYVEARTNMQLSDLLKKPENELINQLCPLHPDSVEMLSKSYVLMVQISIFDCGGIAIGLNASHKILDGLSVSTFMQAWGATARESSKQIHPSFISSSMFPPIPDLIRNTSIMIAKHQMKEHNYVTKRFVFDSSALAALKSKAAIANPSSVTAVMGLVWKSFIVASKKKSILYIPVNLRTKCSPPLPPHSLGNIIWLPSANLCVEEDSNLELEYLVNKIRNAIATINTDFIECIKGGNEIHKLKEFDEKVYYDDQNSKEECIQISSICKTGFYEPDFEWGKPIWSCVTRGNKDLFGLGNIVHLIETKSGDGIEACVTIKEEYMVVLEQNSELLSYASLNPGSHES